MAHKEAPFPRLNVEQWILAGKGHQFEPAVFITFRSPFESVPELLSSGGLYLVKRRSFGERSRDKVTGGLLLRFIVASGTTEISNELARGSSDGPRDGRVSTLEPVQIELVRLEKRNRKYLLTSFWKTARGGRRREKEVKKERTGPEK